MDWLRSCYGSEWHLFADSPATKTGGRYYFAPPDVPFIGSSHFYGSRRWHETNYEKIQGLGEDLESPQPWYNGVGPAVKPNPEQIGPDSCFENGEKIANAVGTDDMREGFITQCFTPQVALDPLWEMASEFDVCALQFFYATLIKWSYEGKQDRIATAFRMLLGDDTVVAWVPGISPLPNISIAIRPTFSVVIANGSADFQTLAMQAFATISLPQNFGNFSTYPLWYATGTYIDSALVAAGVDRTKPMMFVGHSYGGVSLDTLAARYHVAQPTLKIRTMSFGAPKPGDQRLQTLLEGTPGISIANAEDIICSLPPDATTTYPVALLNPLQVLSGWNAWVREPNRARQAMNGILTFNVDPIIDTELLNFLLSQIVLGQPFDTVEPHFISAYRTRIEKRCKRPSWPISLPLWIYLHGADPALGALGLRQQFPDNRWGLGFKKLAPILPFPWCDPISPPPPVLHVRYSCPAVPALDGSEFDVEYGPFLDGNDYEGGGLSPFNYTVGLNLSFDPGPYPIITFLAGGFVEGDVYEMFSDFSTQSVTCGPFRFEADCIVFHQGLETSDHLTLIVTVP